MKQLGINAAVIFLLLIVVGEFSQQRDFNYFSCALKLYTQGVDVYRGPAYGACTITSGQQGPAAAYVFPYPPPLFTALSPLLLFPEAWWRSLIAIVGAALSTVAFVLLSQSFGVASSVRSRIVTTVVVATTIPLLLAAAIGQLTPIFLATLAVFLHFVQSNTRWAALMQGLAAGVFVMKPHLVWLLVPAWFFLSPRWSRLSFFAGASLSATLLTALSWLMNPAAFAAYFDLGVLNLVSFDTPTLASFAGHYMPAGKFGAASVLGVVFVVMAILLRRCMPSRQWLAALMVALGLLASPFLWTYDYALLLPLILWLCAPGRSGNEVVRGALLLGLNALMFAEYGSAQAAGATKPNSEDLWYPVTVVLLCVITAVRLRREEVAVHADRTCQTNKQRLV